MKRQKYLVPLVVRLLLVLSIPVQSISTSLIQLMKDTFRCNTQEVGNHGQL